MIRINLFRPLCECGCRGLTNFNYRENNYNKFIRFHYAKTEKARSVFRKYNKENSWKPKTKESNLKRSKTLKGRVGWSKGLTKETDKRVFNLSKGKKGKKINYSKKINISEETREAASKRMTKMNKTSWRRKQVSEQMKNLGDNHPWKQKEFIEKSTKNVIKRMLNGQAAYMNSCIKNPSKPQVELFELTKKLYNTAQLNYPSLNYSIDIAIPDLNIAIEYDGSYWHQDENPDRIRQKELENIGWKFIRYVDYIPNLEELKNDIDTKYSY